MQSALRDSDDISQMLHSLLIECCARPSHLHASEVPVCLLIPINFSKPSTMLLRVVFANCVQPSRSSSDRTFFGEERRWLIFTTEHSPELYTALRTHWHMAAGSDRPQSPSGAATSGPGGHDSDLIREAPRERLALAASMLVAITRVAAVRELAH